MGRVVLNTVYNVYMYEHVVIYVPCVEGNLHTSLL